MTGWFGRRRTFALCAVFASITIAVSTLVPVGQTRTFLPGFPLGFFQSGIVAGMGATFAELFPTHVRATGQGFSDNFGRGVGSLVPTVVGILGATTRALNEAVGICALFSYGLVLVAAVFLPETRQGAQLARAGAGPRLLLMRATT